MSDQVTNKSAVPEEIQVRVLEMALPSSASPSDLLLRRIATLLLILVAGLLTVFGYYASSICITVLLAGFLAILFDPWWSSWRNCIYRECSRVVLVGMGQNPYARKTLIPTSPSS